MTLTIPHLVAIVAVSIFIGVACGVVLVEYLEHHYRERN